MKMKEEITERKKTSFSHAELNFVDENFNFQKKKKKKKKKG